MAIFKVISGFFSRYATAFKYGSVVVVALSIGYGVYDYSKLRERTAIYERDNQKLTETIESVRQDLKQSNQNIQDLRNRNLSVEVDYNEALDRISALEQITPEQLSENKPDIQTELNTQYNAVRREIRCVTGDSASC